MALLVGFSVEGEWLLAIAFVGHDGFRAALAQPMTQFGTVVSSIAKKLSGCLVAPYQTPCRRTIMGLAARQQDGKKTAFSICDCVDFRVAPAARASNRLVLFPLFAPEAERWALT